MRSFTIIDSPQRSLEWFAARAGRLTGSCAGEIAATLKSGGEPAGRRDLRTRLVLERLTGRSLEDDYINADMRRGIELEPDALALFEAFTGTIVQQTGFLSHTELPIGCSLDGHIGDFESILELKVPRAANHWKYLKAGVLPAEHRYQIIHNLLVTGARRADFCSYGPDFPEPLRLFRVCIERNKTDIAAYEFMLRGFLKECDKELEEIEQLAGAAV